MATTHLYLSPNIAATPLHITTPLLYSTHLSKINNCNVWLKLENLQPSSTFKIRGVGYMAQKSVLEQGYQRLVSSSSSNTGYAVAYAGRQLSVPVTIVVPHSARPGIQHILRNEGANVIVHGTEWEEANSFAMSLCASDPSAAYIPPFDHPLLWEGHATIVNEILDQLQEAEIKVENTTLRAMKQIIPDLVICTVGGGGLLNGLVQGFQAAAHQVPIMAVETHGANLFHASVLNFTQKKSTLTHLQPSAIESSLQKECLEPAKPKVATSVASSLGAKTVSKKSLENFTQYPIIPFCVSDEMSGHACLQLLEHHKMLVELASGAGLSLVFNNLIPEFLFHGKPIQERHVVVVVSGGSDVSLEDVLLWSQSPNYMEPNIAVRCGQEVYLRFWGEANSDQEQSDLETSTTRDNMK